MFIHLTFPTALIVMYGPGVVLSLPPPPGTKTTAPQWAAASPLKRINDPTQTRHTWLESSVRVISLRQRPPINNAQHSQETVIHGHGGIPNHIPSKQAAANPNLRPQD